MHVQAGALPAEIHREPAAACGQHEDGVDLLHRLFYGESAGEWTDVVGVGVVGVVGVGYPRIGSLAHLDVVIPLVVLEQNVVFRLVQLYQAAFQHKRVQFARADDEVEIHDVVDQLQCLCVVVGVVPEIGGHAVLERLCLADIDYLPGLVLHQIHAGA